MGALIAVGARAEPREVDAFVLAHRCEVVAGLSALYGTPEHPDDRYLILSWPTSGGDYVQCEFESDNSRILCEAASRFYHDEAPGLTPEGLASLGHLGFSTDASKGNFAQFLPLSGPDDLTRVAELMLRALFEGYRGRAGRQIDWNSAYAPRALALALCDGVS